VGESEDHARYLREQLRELESVAERTRAELDQYAPAHALSAEGAVNRAASVERLGKLYEYIARVKQIIAGLEASAALPPPREQRTVQGEAMMSADHRANLATSQLQHSKRFSKWIREPEHGRWTINGLSKAVPMAASSISQAQRRKNDPLSRPIRKDRAERIQQLTGWPADEAHWPGGILDDDE